jgi:hypothetical protein
VAGIVYLDFMFVKFVFKKDCWKICLYTFERLSPIHQKKISLECQFKHWKHKQAKAQQLTLGQGHVLLLLQG